MPSLIRFPARAVQRLMKYICSRVSVSDDLIFTPPLPRSQEIVPHHGDTVVAVTNVLRVSMEDIAMVWSVVGGSCP
jgi:hypothetical protein